MKTETISGRNLAQIVHLHTQLGCIEQGASILSLALAPMQRQGLKGIADNISVIAEGLRTELVGSLVRAGIRADMIDNGVLSIVKPLDLDGAVGEGALPDRTDGEGLPPNGDDRLPAGQHASKGQNLQQKRVTGAKKRVTKKLGKGK